MQKGLIRALVFDSTPTESYSQTAKLPTYGIITRTYLVLHVCGTAKRHGIAIYCIGDRGGEVETLKQKRTEET